MKSILIIFSLMSMLLISQIAEAITVSVSDASGYPGDINIPVTISATDIGPEEIYGIDLVLSYDANLIQTTNVAVGTLTSNWSIASNTAISGQVTIALFSAAPLPSGKGSIAEIDFDVNQGASPAVVSQLILSKANFEDRPAGVIHGGSFTIEAVPEELAEQEELEEIIFEEEEVEETEELSEEVVSIEEDVGEYETLGPAPRIIVYREPEEETLESVIPEELPPDEETLEIFTEEVVTPQTAPIEEQPQEEYLERETRLSLITRGKEALERPEMAKEKEEPRPAKIEVKELKRILFWKVYQLQLEDENIQPFFWQLKDEQRLPFLLRLNKRKGTIYGIAWGSTTLNLGLVVMTQDRETFEASCALEIK